MPGEVDVGTQEDYEVVPLTPIRRLEKKIESLETNKSLTNMERFMDKVIDMVELNQKLVDDVVESNQGLREDLGVMIGKMDNLTDKIDEFVTMIKQAGQNEADSGVTKDMAEKVVSPLVDKMEDMHKRGLETQTHMIEILDNIEKRLKRIGNSEVAASPASLLARRQGL